MKFICKQSVLNEAVNAVSEEIATVTTVSSDNQTTSVKSSVSSIIEKLPDIVFHGTISIHRDSLITGIDVYKGYESTDFGQGFYTTSNYEQAKRLAYDRAKAYNKHHKDKPPAQPMVLKYRINKVRLSEYKGLIFDSPNERWKEFIFNNRVGIDFSVSKYYNKDGRYNFVYGCVADSNITNMVGDIKRQKITYGEFIDSLKALKQYEYDQLSFHTTDVVSALDLLEIEIIEMEAILIE